MKSLSTHFLIAVTFFLVLSTTSAVSAQTAPQSAAGGSAQFNADAATATHMATLSPEARAKSDRYFEGGYWLLVWDFVAGLVVAWLFLGTGLSRRLRDWAERKTRFKTLQTGIYGLFYVLISTLVLLPWAAYQGYFREHQYGMSNQDIAAWLGDQMKELGLELILSTMAMVVIYAVFRRAARGWWIWGSLVSIVLLIFFSTIGPVYLEPVFNDIKPLAESPLKAQILSMARANEIPATDVYQYDASKQTKRISAHVSGFFGTIRISMNDNLLHRGSPEEIKAVLGHEMGHYVLNHAYERMVFLSIIIIAGFAFLHWSFIRLQAGQSVRWGIRDIGDVAGLPLLVFLFSVYAFGITPIQNTIIRSMEAEADNYGLNASRQPDGFAQAALHLAEYRKMQPGPIEEFLMYDHPSGWNRIHRSMVWKQEHINDADIVEYDVTHAQSTEAAR